MLIASAVVFFVFLIIATNIGRKALLRLSAEEKVVLVDVAGKTPIYGFVVLAVVVAAWVAIFYFQPEYAINATMVCMLLILLMSAISAVTLYRQMQKAGLPADFLRSYLLSRVLRLSGAAVFFTTMCLWLFWQMSRHA